MSSDRDEGRFTERISLEDVLGVFDHVKGPVVTSSDVADRLDCSGETARRKLRELAETGRVESRKTAGRVVWWRTDAETTAAEIDPDDSFWDADPVSGDDVVDESDVDDLLYGEVDS